MERDPARAHATRPITARPLTLPAGIVLVPVSTTARPLVWPDGSEVLEHPDPWGSDPKDRWVRLFATVGSDGVWRVDGATDVLEELPISSRMVARIRRWARWYDKA